MSWGQLWAQRQNRCYPQTPEVETSASWFVYTGNAGVFDSLTSVVLSFPINPVRFVACLCVHTLAQGFETQQTLTAVERFFHAVIFQDLIYKTEIGAVYTYCEAQSRSSSVGDWPLANPDRVLESSLSVFAT